MDHNIIPDFAQNRHIGTVIVRRKMCEEVTTTCCQREECPASGCPVEVHRPSGCELCNRTRLISQYSDCDSDIVDKCRPYRSSSARSRYVNVCAAVCLLLLVGGLSPQSSAAPHRSRSTMDRQRRATSANGAPKENSFWANPCDYNNSNTKPVYSREIVRKFVVQAKTALSSAANYKDSFASILYSFKTFDKLLETWESDNWLRNYSWYREEVLPKEKILNQTMPDEYVDDLVKNKMNDVMPSMYKGLKIIVAGFYAFSKEGLNDNIISDEALKTNITQTMHDVRSVLCYFSDIMKARELEILPVLDSEVPDFNTNDKLSVGVLLYRDTLNYLEYLAQVFQKLYESESA